MSSIGLTIILGLIAPAAPAPKAEGGLPKDLIDLIPADAAGALVIDAPKLVKSEVGKAIVKTFETQQRPNMPLLFADLGTESEWIVLTHFLIDEGIGDFALIVRLKEKSELGKALVTKATTDGVNPELIGGRRVYSVFRPDFAYSMIDDRTLMVALATSPTPADVKTTMTAAFAIREKPGPSRDLRMMIELGAKDERAIRFYGHHARKVSHSAYMPLCAFGVQRTPIAGLGDKLVSYRGGVRAGDTGEIELRLTAKSGEAAKELLKTYDLAEPVPNALAKHIRSGAKIVRDGDEVIITATLTTAMLEQNDGKAKK